MLPAGADKWEVEETENDGDGEESVRGEEPRALRKNRWAYFYFLWLLIYVKLLNSFKLFFIFFKFLLQFLPAAVRTFQRDTVKRVALKL